MTLQWVLKNFDDLTPDELYKILQLRSQVFVVEQQCIFLDADDNDQHSVHLMCMQEQTLAAYCRLVPPGIIYTEASIGRVVSSPVQRQKGLGRMLMQQAIEACYQLFGNDVIKIGAQLYLKEFYRSFGFVQNGDVYIEDGIEHIYMYLSKT